MKAVAVYLHCRVHHGYHDRGSNPVQLGGSSGGCVKPPARTGSMDGPGALTTLYSSAYLEGALAQTQASSGLVWLPRLTHSRRGSTLLQE
jgi:hypothetical protein